MKTREYRTDPLAVYDAGLGWQRISSMVMVRDVRRLYGFRVWRSEWRPYHEKTVMYLKDGVWHQPADVAASHVQARPEDAS